MVIHSRYRWGVIFDIFHISLHFSVNFVSLNFTDYVSMALCMGDNRVGDTSGQLAMPQEMGLARRGFTSGTSSPS